TGETWTYLDNLSKEDGRLSVVRNSGPHGQVGNTNNGLLHAKGSWIKILHDDDVRAPHCIERLLDAVDGLGGVAVISCLPTRMRSGKPWKRDRGGGAACELIRSR